MRFLVEHMKEIIFLGNTDYEVDIPKTENMPNETAANARFNVLKNKSPNKKFRVHEHTHEDTTPSPCIILDSN